MVNPYQVLLSAAIDGFYEAMANNNGKEKLYYKGISEGMMKIIREADLLGHDDIGRIIDGAKQKYTAISDNQKAGDSVDIDIPAFVRQGKTLSF